MRPSRRRSASTARAITCPRACRGRERRADAATGREDRAQRSARSDRRGAGPSFSEQGRDPADTPFQPVISGNWLTFGESTSMAKTNRRIPADLLFQNVVALVTLWRSTGQEGGYD